MTCASIMEYVMSHYADEPIDGTQTRDAESAFVAGPLLAELLSDPMTQQLMAADGVDRRELEAVLQRARSQLGLFGRIIEATVR